MPKIPSKGLSAQIPIWAKNTFAARCVARSPGTGNRKSSQVTWQFQLGKGGLKTGGWGLKLDGSGGA